MKLVTFTGLSRSGNHAIIRWLISHYESAGYEVYFYNNTVVHFLEHLNFIFPHIEKNTKKIFFVSFEDITLNNVFRDLLKISDLNFLLLRDPFNLYASRIEGLGYPRGRLTAPEKATIDHMPKEIDKYFNHYEEFISQTSFIPNKVCIKYNEWVKDRPYRRTIIQEKVNLPFNDARYQLRAGSSFGDSKRPETEDYENRWKLCWNQPMYDYIKNDKRILQISKSLFSINPYEKLI